MNIDVWTLLACDKEGSASALSFYLVEKCSSWSGKLWDYLSSHLSLCQAKNGLWLHCLFGLDLGTLPYLLGGQAICSGFCVAWIEGFFIELESTDGGSKTFVVEPRKHLSSGHLDSVRNPEGYVCSSIKKEIEKSFDNTQVVMVVCVCACDQLPKILCVCVLCVFHLLPRHAARNEIARRREAARSDVKWTSSLVAACWVLLMCWLGQVWIGSVLNDGSSCTQQLRSLSGLAA